MAGSASTRLDPGDADSSHPRPFAAAAKRLRLSNPGYRQAAAGAGLGADPADHRQALCAGAAARTRSAAGSSCAPPMPSGPGARLPWVRDLKIVGDLGRRLDRSHPRGAARYPARPFAGPQCVAGDPRRPPPSHPGRLRGPRFLGRRCGEPWEPRRGRAALSRDPTGRNSRSAPRRRGDDDLRAACAAEIVARGIPAEKVTVIPNAVDRNAFRGPGHPGPGACRPARACRQ